MSAQVRQTRPGPKPRLANVIAGQLRESILAGEIADGEPLPSQERLMERFEVSQPSIREALRMLEADGLITVRRGKNGGAIVHVPTNEVAARTIAAILQSRTVCLEDVGQAIQCLEPICADLAARRRDRRQKVVPGLRRQLEVVASTIDDPERYREESARFHSELVQSANNQTLALLVGALESLWAGHARARATSDNWPSPVGDSDRRRYAKSMVGLVDAIEAGDAELARSTCAAHLEKATRHTLVDDDRIEVEAALLREE
jgi:DNA-binding FadR family transcriptional regulator